MEINRPGLLRHALGGLLVTALALTAQADDTATETADGATDSRTTVLIRTNRGTLEARLYDRRAPLTVRNFLRYVDDGFYTDTLIHRAVPHFVIQGGGYTAAGEPKPTRPPVKNESRNRLRHTRGTLAMARQADPDSATSQFFINLARNRELDYRFDRPGYTVFGEITRGLSVADAIAESPRGRRFGLDDVPDPPVVIEAILRKPVTP